MQAQRTHGARSKLVRNLRPGDVIEVTDATHYPSRTHRVTVTRVCETRPGLSGRRMWEASFTPTVSFTWRTITAYSDTRIEVYS